MLEWANLKLAAVATNVVGVSARAMREASVDGQSDVAALAELAQGRLRAMRELPEQALVGRVREHHRGMIARHLEHIDVLDAQRATFDAQIAALIVPVAPPATPPAAADTSPPRLHARPQRAGRHNVALGRRGRDLGCDPRHRAPGR